MALYALCKPGPATVIVFPVRNGGPSLGVPAETFDEPSAANPVEVGEHFLALSKRRVRVQKAGDDRDGEHRETDQKNRVDEKREPSRRPDLAKVELGALMGKSESRARSELRYGTVHPLPSARGRRREECGVLELVGLLDDSDQRRGLARDAGDLQLAVGVMQLGQVSIVGQGL